MDNFLKYIDKNGGFARMRDLKEAAFHTRTVAQYLKSGKIEKVKPGLYRLAVPGKKNDENLSFADVCNAVPKGIICLTSALAHYELTTFNPSEVFVAIPTAEKPQKILFPPTKFFFFPERFYRLGIVRTKTSMGEVRIYSMEKTICDMFRYRNKLGEDLAVEALKNYLKRKNRNLKLLQEYAVKCQVKNVLLPYLRALVG